MLNVVMLNVVMLSAVMVSVFMLNVVVPELYRRCYQSIVGHREHTD